ncbi:hypothetical protein VNO77_15173 [Canavalia gladiata]|uniref:Uncharacterized protein n=1 Tax=Canavalia gladiata TaxID=3824 RepID=A0AAN9LYR3_CANGL
MGNESCKRSKVRFYYDLSLFNKGHEIVSEYLLSHLLRLCSDIAANQVDSKRVDVCACIARDFVDLNVPKILPLLPHPSNTTRRVNPSRIPPLESIRSHGSEESSHAASDNGLDISTLLKVDQDPIEFSRQSTSLHGDRSTHESIQPTPKTSLNQDNSRFIRGYNSSIGSDSSSMIMMKCLFDGRILPRPNDEE